MLSIENNELLTRVGPDTPMGTLMRHYWQPVCGVDDLLKSPFRTQEVIEAVMAAWQGQVDELRRRGI